MRKVKIKSFSPEKGRYEFKEEAIFHRWTDKGQAVVEKSTGHCGLFDADDVQFLNSPVNRIKIDK